MAHRLFPPNSNSHRGSFIPHSGALDPLPLRGRALSRPPKAPGTLIFSGFTPQHIEYMKMHPHPILNVIFAIKIFKGFL